MTNITIQNSSREIAVYGYKSVNRKLHQVADWIDTICDIPNVGGYREDRWDDNLGRWVVKTNFPHGRGCSGGRMSQDMQRWIAEDKAIIANGGYKRAIAMLAPLAAPPPVDLVSDQIMLLIASKPFGHMVPPEFSRLVIEEIGYMDPEPSIAAVMIAFREMRLTPGPNVADLGTVIQCIAAGQKRFQAKYGPLIELEDRCRQRVALLPKVIEKERAGASVGDVYLWVRHAMSVGAKEEQTHEREQGLDLAGLQAFLSPSMASPPLTPRASVVVDGDTDGDLLD
jgi:hypothetical protein